MSQVYILPNGLKKDKIMHRYKTWPKLLKACEEIQQYNKAAESGRIDPDSGHDYWDSVMSYVDAAIEATMPQGEKGDSEASTPHLEGGPEAAK
jgi:hypothetical protein